MIPRHKRIWNKIVSSTLALCFFISNPSFAQTPFSDVLRPNQEIQNSSKLAVTNPEVIKIAENIGRVKEIFRGEPQKLVINIQDAHCNFEAQTNISQILDALGSEYGLNFVALEGSSGEIDPSLFTTFPDEEIRKEVATYFLKKGKINGAEYLAITSKNPPTLYGIETKEYYLANLAAFNNIMQGRDAAKAACKNVEARLDALKPHIYSKELAAFDIKVTAYNSEKLGLVDFCKFLGKDAARLKIPASTRYPNLGLFFKTLEIETAIDFNKVEEERSKLISVFEKALSKKDLEALFANSLEFKSGHISAGRYHEYLRELAKLYSVDTKTYRSLELYTDYLVIYEKINNYNLFKEIALLEDEILEKLLKNEDQRRLSALSKNIRLLSRMFDIALSKEDVDYYQKNKADFNSAAFTNFIETQTRRLNEPAGYDPEFKNVNKYLPDLENFYRIADTRDEAIIENTLQQMDQKGLSIVALITGGYHTEGIAKKLRDRGISYMVISPRITKADTANPYLEILSHEKAPSGINLSPNSKNLAVNSGLEKKGGCDAVDKAAFAQEVKAELATRKAAREAAPVMLPGLVNTTYAGSGMPIMAATGELSALLEGDSLAGMTGTWTITGFHFFSMLEPNPAGSVTLTWSGDSTNAITVDMDVVHRLMDLYPAYAAARKDDKLAEFDEQARASGLNPADYTPSLGMIYQSMTLSRHSSPGMFWENFQAGDSGIPPEALFACLGMQGSFALCGVVSVVGQAGAVAAYESKVDLAYRGYDNAGEVFITWEGLRLAKVKGGPEILMRTYQLLGQGHMEEGLWCLDALQLEDPRLIRAHRKLKTGEFLSYEDRAALHAKWRSLTPAQKLIIERKIDRERKKLADSEGLGSLTEAVIPASRLSEIGLATNVSMGQMGSRWSGNVYAIEKDSTANKWESPNRLVSAVRQDFEFATRTIRLLVEFELEEAMQQHKRTNSALYNEFRSTFGTEENALLEYERLFDRVVLIIGDEEEMQERSEELTTEDKRKWNILWRFLEGRELKISATYPKDGVRSCFRKQGGIVGALDKHQGWKTGIEAEFRQLPDCEGLDWGACWKQEMMLNVAGKAFSAFTIWFQKKFISAQSRERFGIKLGVIDPITYRYLARAARIVGHDRWGTAGSIELEDGQPVVDPAEERGAAHNGEIGDDVAAAIEKDLEAAGVPIQTGRWFPGLAPAPILNDTARFMADWGVNWYGQFTRDVQTEGLIDANDYYVDFNERPAAMPVERRRKWNELMRIAHDNAAAGIISEANPDEVALRGSLNRCAPSSTMAMNLLSSHMPQRDLAVSHNRPLLVVIRDNGDYSITSDKNTALRLWKRAEVERDVVLLNRIKRAARKKINAAIDELNTAEAALGRGLEAKETITAGDIEAYRLQKKALRRAFRMKLKEAFAEMDASIAAAGLSKKYRARVINIKGPGKVAEIKQEISPEGRWETKVVITDLDGRLIPESEWAARGIKIEEQGEIEIDIADKGGKRTFAEKHIEDIPWVELRSMAKYIETDDAGNFNIDMARKMGRRVGINIDALLKHFSEDSQSLENLERIILTGIGSSDNISRMCELILRMLFPGVDILIRDPQEINSVGEYYNSKTDLVIGFTWSGETAPTLSTLERFKNSGFMVMCVTGCPESQIGILTSESAGTVHAETGRERAVYTTVGLDGMVYDTCCAGAYLSPFYAKGAVTQGPEFGQIEQLRQQYISDLERMPLLKKEFLESPENKLTDDASAVNQLARDVKDVNAILCVGSPRNQPSIYEIALKIKEVGWIESGVYDYTDPAVRNLIEASVWQGHNKGVFVDATDQSRSEDIVEFLAFLKNIGAKAIVLASPDDEELFAKIEALSRASNKDIKISKISKGKKVINGAAIEQPVSRELQGQMNVLWGFVFATAFAKAKRLSPVQTDAPRNLAKSVTVEATPVASEQITVVEYAAAVADVDITERLNAYGEYLRARWDTLRTPWEQATYRLPFVTADFAGCLSRPERFSLNSMMLTERFGKRLERLKKIVVVTDDRDMAEAARNAQLTFRYRETTETKRALWDKGRADNVLINHKLFTVVYDEAKREFRFEYRHKTGVVEVAAVVQGDKNGLDTPTVKINDREYNARVDEKRGLILEAALPEFLGVPIVIHRTDDWLLQRDVQNEGSLVVCLSRSNDRGKDDADVLPLADPIRGRPQEVLKSSRQQAKAEDRICSVLRGINTPNVFVIADGMSAALPLAQGKLGHISLPEDVDVCSLANLTYMAIMRLGVELGRAKGMPEDEMNAYQVMIEKGATLTAMDTLTSRVGTDGASLMDYLEERVTEMRYNAANIGYDTVQIDGGAQDCYSGALIPLYLERNGVVAVAYPGDQQVHGPAAAYNNDRSKFTDRILQTGVNPQYNPNPPDDPKGKDAFFVCLGTDLAGFPAAAIDRKRVSTRSGRVGLIVPQSLADSIEVRNAHAQFTAVVPDTPVAAIPLVHTVTGNMLACAWQRSRNVKYNYQRGLTLQEAMQPPHTLQEAHERSRKVEAANFRHSVANALNIPKFDETTLSGDPLAVQVVAAPSFADIGDGRPGIAIVMPDQPGIGEAVLAELAHYGINVYQIDARNAAEGYPNTAIGRFTLDCPYEDIERLRLVEKIKSRLTLAMNIVLLPFAETPVVGDLNDATDQSVAQVVFLTAGSLMNSGIVGVAAEASLGPAQLRDRIREEWMPRFGEMLVGRTQALLNWELAAAATPRRSVTLQDADRGYYYNIADGITPVIYDGIDAVSYVVYGEAVKKLGTPPAECPAHMLAAYIPQDNLDEAAKASLARLLDPNRGIAEDASGMSEVLETLNFIARANGRLTKDAQPNLSGLRVIVTDTPRERRMLEYLRALKTRFGLNIEVIKEGRSSFLYGVRACMPPQAGAPLDVLWTGCGSPQALAVYSLTNGLRNSWASFRILSGEVNRQARGQEAAPNYLLGFGGALDFTPAELESIRSFCANSGMEGAVTVEGIRSGEFLFTPSLIAGYSPSSAVIVPLLPTSSFRMPHSNEPLAGIRETEGGNAQLNIIHVHNGAAWIEQDTARLADFEIPGQLKLPDFLQGREGAPAAVIDYPADIQAEAPDFMLEPVLASPTVLGLISTPEAQAASQAKIRQLREKGVTVGDNVFIADDVSIENIDAGAVIHTNACISGKDTRIGSGTHIYGTVDNSVIGRDVIVDEGSVVIASTIEDGAIILGSDVTAVIVHRGATLRDCVVITEGYNPSEPDTWTSDNKGMVKVSGHPTEIGEGAEISDGAYVKNSIVGARTKITGGSVISCEIGEDNEIARMKLILVHTEFDVKLLPRHKDGSPAIAEMQERWLGFGYRFTGAECYGEGSWDNLLPTVGYGLFALALDDFGGYHAVDSSFDGTGNWGIGAEVTDLKCRPVTSSGHKYMLAQPLVAYVADGENTIGLSNNPDPTQIVALDTTITTPGALLGDAGAARGSTWGAALGPKKGPRWTDDKITAFITEHPNIFALRIIRALNYARENQGRIDKALRDRGITGAWFKAENMGHLVEGIIAAKCSLIRELLFNAQDPDLGIGPAFKRQLEDAVRPGGVFDQHLNSGLWEIRDGQLVNWELNAAGNDAILRDHRFLGLFDSPPRHWPTISQFVNTPEDPLYADRYNPKVISDEDMQMTVVTPQRTGRVPERYRNAAGIRIHPKAILSDDVDIKPGTPERPTYIGAGTMLQGKITVRAGARLYRCVAEGDDITFGRGGQYSFVSARTSNGGIEFGDNTVYRVCTVSAVNKRVRHGAGSSADHNYLENTSYGEGTIGYAYATARDFKTGRKCKVGGMHIDGEWGTLVCAQHVGYRGYNVFALDQNGIANASNFADNAVMGKRGGRPVQIGPSTFVASNSIMPEGAVTTYGCWIKGEMLPDDARTPLPPLTYFSDRIQYAGVIMPDVGKRLNNSFMIRFLHGYPTRPGASEEQKRNACFAVEKEGLLRCGRWLLTNMPRLQMDYAGPELSALDTAAAEALSFINDDLEGHISEDFTVRSDERGRNFRTAMEALASLERAVRSEDLRKTWLAPLQVVLTRLAEGRYRVRPDPEKIGIYTDGRFVNTSTIPHRPKVVWQPRGAPGRAAISPDYAAAATAAAV